MSRLQQLFKNKQRNILNVYCTAGYPEKDSTITVMQALQQSGADIIELGMPYSDPVADGPVIQQSNMQALNNGMSVPVLFEQLSGLRNTIHIPVILMGYLNPVLQFGFERFCTEAAALGVDGLIIPDLPAGVFSEEYEPVIKKAGLDFIFLITPETSPERIRLLDSLSSGFLYAVTASATTGSENSTQQVSGYLERIAAMNLNNPVLAGFGIKNNMDFERVCRYTHGAITGSAFINELQKGGDIFLQTESFIQSIRGW